MTGSVQDEVPVLMSGAGHDAMALSHLTKVCYHEPNVTVCDIFLVYNSGV